MFFNSCVNYSFGSGCPLFGAVSCIMCSCLNFQPTADIHVWSVRKHEPRNPHLTDCLCGTSLVEHVQTCVWLKSDITALEMRAKDWSVHDGKVKPLWQVTHHRFNTACLAVKKVSDEFRRCSDRCCGVYTTKLISHPASEQVFLSSGLRDHFEPIFTTQTFFLDKTLNLQPV